MDSWHATLTAGCASEVEAINRNMSKTRCAFDSKTFLDNINLPESRDRTAARALF
jgi:hypothetical protein